MNILYMANLIPYPLDGGGKIFTYSTIQALSKDNDVDLVCFYEHEDIKEAKKELSKYCSSIDVLPIKVTTRDNMPLMLFKAIQSIFSNMPLGVSKYIIPEMKSLIKKKIEEKKYDCVFFNILSMFGYCAYIKNISPQIKVILYEQNCESLIYKRYFDQTNNIIKKMFLKMEIRKLEQFEKLSVEETDQLLLLSEADQKELGISSEKCNIIPIGVTPSHHCKNYNTEKVDKLKMLFIGTMTWAPNNEGIIWFLKNVMPLCNNKKKYELFIVGKNPSSEVKKICESYENVNLMGYIESLDTIYDECDVLVVPLFIGSGQRVKIIEAFSRGYAVISTSIGAEGLKYKDGESILIANSASDFITNINRCFDRELLKSLGKAGKDVFDSEYSITVISRKINDALK